MTLAPVFLGSLGRRRMASLFSLLAIILGVALGMAVQAIHEAALNEFGRGVRTLAGEADLRLVGPASGFDEALFEQILRHPDIAAATPIVEIEAKLDISAHDIYGLTELIGPGVAAECAYRDGLHFNEDYFYPEIVDPDSGEVLPDGAKGELVITSLGREGSPLLRYRTRDITFLMREPCACGRTTTRIHRLLGRTDDMLIVRGVNCFPSQIENVLLRIEGTQPHYQIVIDRGATHLDEIEIQVEVEDAIFSDITRGMEQLRSRIHAELKSELGLSARIKLVEPRSIARSEGKAKRIIDKRSLG